MGVDYSKELRVGASISEGLWLLGELIKVDGYFDNLAERRPFRVKAPGRKP